MTTLDWIAVAIVAVSALIGLRRGLIATALQLAGIAVGAIIGARLAPHLLHKGAHSPWTPAIALAGAVIGATLLQGVGSLAGSILRSGLRIPPLRSVDSVAGLLLGAVTGLGIVWVLGAVALQVPGQTKLRRDVQRSQILRRLNELVPPSTLLHALSRIDPFPHLTGPEPAVPPPTSAILASPNLRRAGSSVVRVTGSACGLGIEGSGWVAAPHTVVTAAHVVAGERSTRANGLAAQVVHFDPHNDVAVLRVPALNARALPLVEPQVGAPVAIVGYPNDGPLDATPGRIAETTEVLAQDAYGRGPVAREVTALRGVVRHGDSGAPAIDARGAVQTTVFAARIGSASGYGVPTPIVRRALEQARGPVSSGPCAP